MLPAIRSPKELSISIWQELPKYFNKAEIEAMLEAVRNNPKEHLLLNLLWQTGARVTEALSITVQDIDFYARAVKLMTLKRRKGKKAYRVIPLQPNLIGEIGAYIAAKGLARDKKLINITRQRAFEIVKNTALKAGLDRARAHPHTLRHSFAVHAVLSNVPILVIKDWLGHANITNTLVYTKVLGGDTRRFYEELRF